MKCRVQWEINLRTSENYNQLVVLKLKNVFLPQITDAFGTVRYSSPEMAADSGIGQKTDIWSAGALMYFMLSGSAPFLKKDDVDTLDYIKKKPKVRKM